MLTAVHPVPCTLFVASAFIASCNDPRPPPLEQSPIDSGDTGGIHVIPSPCTGPPPPGGSNYCGNEVVQVLTDKPVGYFVLDGSGSMRDVFEDTSRSKLLSAKLAIRDLLFEIGHRVRYGAAVFPDTKSGESCALGTQVFPATEGDSLFCHAGKTGPVLRRLLDSISFRDAEGGTPIAETLARLAPTLSTLGTRVSVVLITDGAPNCNLGASCSPEACIANVEQHLLGELVCGRDLDCCDPTQVKNASLNCIDSEQTIRVVADLADNGIRTFVVGMPGSEAFVSVLDGLAEAGQTAREDQESKYYSVREGADLSKSLFAIGSEVSLSCQLSLASAPPDPDLLNLYFDSDPVELDGENGWSYSGDSLIELHGRSCDVLKSGAVTEVQVVAGCPTLIK
jgi:hypothetical protein